MRPRLDLPAAKGDRLGVEYVGEEVTDPAAVGAICEEYLAFVDECDADAAQPVQLGFDLSDMADPSRIRFGAEY